MMIDLQRIIDLRHPHLRANLQKCFEDTTGLAVEGISISVQSSILVNTVTGKPSGNEFNTYTIEIQVPTSYATKERLT